MRGAARHDTQARRGMAHVFDGEGGNHGRSLNGIRVFDLAGSGNPAPRCWETCADVIKIERPDADDDTVAAPPFIRDDAGRDTSKFVFLLRQSEQTVDHPRPHRQRRPGPGPPNDRRKRCVVENFKTGGLAKYGLDYASLKDEFPGLIYCSITGFGHTGPYAPRPGYDVLIQAMSGFMSLTGEPDGGPQKAGLPVADLMAGMYAAVAINAALLHKEKTGFGQHIDIGMLDVMTAFSTIRGSITWPPAKCRRGSVTPIPTSFPTKRSKPPTATLFWRSVMTANSKILRFRRLHPSGRGPRFDNNQKRVQNRANFTESNQIIAAKPSQFWLDGMRNGH